MILTYINTSLYILFKNNSWSQLGQVIESNYLDTFYIALEALNL